jgi:hypothetical protein
MVGTTAISGSSQATSSSISKHHVQPFRRPPTLAAALIASLQVPAPKPNPVKKGGNAIGFAGLTTVDTVNTNGFTLSPPDQGLCVGNGFVLETINLVMAVYSKTGKQLTAPESATELFGELHLEIPLHFIQ